MQCSPRLGYQCEEHEEYIYFGLETLVTEIIIKCSNAAVILNHKKYGIKKRRVVKD